MKSVIAIVRTHVCNDIQNRCVQEVKTQYIAQSVTAHFSGQSVTEDTFLDAFAMHIEFVRNASPAIKILKRMISAVM